MNISIWEHESFFARKDVIIMGGGLAGLWCAYELLLKNPSLTVLILDSGIVPRGASTRNAGFACFGSPTELLHDAKNMGEEAMLTIADMRYRGIQKIRTILGDAVIDYDACGGFECLQNSNYNPEEIGDKLNWLNSLLHAVTGSKQTFTVSTEKLAGFGFQGFDALLENKFEGGLHSGKLVMALQEKVRSMGAQIMQGIELEHWEESNGIITIHTKQNIGFQASHLLICTNALTNQLLPGINIAPARGQILITNPIKNLPVRGTFHFDEGFYYFRNLNNRILLGGARNHAFEEEATTSFETSTVVQNRLEQFLQTHILPRQSYQVEYRWSGIMDFTEDKQPIVKRLSDRVSAVIICNGMGVAMSPVIAEQIEL